jgi:hypothetical protein
MRFSVITVALFLGSTLASPLSHEKRDLSEIQMSVQQVTAVLMQLDRALKDPKPPINNLDAQQRYLTDLINLDNQAQYTMSEGSRRIRSVRNNMNELEATRLLGIMNPLLMESRSIMQGWTNVKYIARSVGMIPVVRDQLARGATQSSGYADAIISKLPTVNRLIGQSFKSSIMSPIDKCINGYI